MRFRFMLWCLSSLAVLDVAAQEDSIAGQVHTIGEVTVQSHAVDANVVSATPIQTMSGGRLQELGITSLADAVKRFAGADVRDYGGIGGLKTVSVRNLGAHHTAVSYDGVPVGNAQAGQVDIGRYTTDNLSDVSFVIGQGGDMMQSARHYASAGVLSIETVRPLFDKKNYRINAQVRGGSFGWVSPALTYWQKLGENTSLSCHGNYTRADGVYPFTLKNGYTKSREKRYNSDVESWQGEANLFHTFRNGDEWQAKVAYYQSERGLPGAVILYNHDANERLWDKNFFVQSIYRKVFSGKWKLQGRLKYNYAWDRYEDTNPKYQGGKQTDINRQHEYYASLTMGWHPTKEWSVTLAQDVMVNKLHNNFDYAMQPIRFTSLTVLASQYHTGRLTANGTLLYTFAHEHLKSGTAPDDRRRLSPALSLSYRLLEGETLFVRGMVKGTFRLPSFNDLYYQRIGNNKLRPERATEYNVGLTWSRRMGKAFDVHATADVYYNKVYDKIVAFPSTYVWKMVNFGEVDIKGLDVTMGMDVAFSKDIHAQLLASYMLQDAIDRLDNDQQIPYVPRHSGNGSLTIRTPWVTLGYSVMAQGERFSNVTQRTEYRLHPFWEHSLTLSRDFLFGKNKVALSASLLNLTDEQYEIVQYYPMPGRSWQVAIRVDL